MQGLVLLADGTGDFARAQKFVSRFRAMAPAGTGFHVFREDHRAADLAREAGAGQALPLSCIFQELSRPDTRRVILVANGLSGKHRPDIAAEVQAGEMLRENKNASLVFLRVGARKTGLDEMMRSVAAMPGLRLPPVFETAPDPDAARKVVARIISAPAP